MSGVKVSPSVSYADLQKRLELVEKIVTKFPSGQPPLSRINQALYEVPTMEYFKYLAKSETAVGLCEEIDELAGLYTDTFFEMLYPGQDKESGEGEVNYKSLAEGVRDLIEDDLGLISEDVDGNSDDDDDDDGDDGKDKSSDDLAEAITDADWVAGVVHNHFLRQLPDGVENSWVLINDTSEDVEDLKFDMYTAVSTLVRHLMEGPVGEIEVDIADVCRILSGINYPLKQLAKQVKDADVQKAAVELQARLRVCADYLTTRKMGLS